VVGRPAERERLGLLALGEGERRRTATPVAGIQRLAHRHHLGGEQDHLRPPPSHHRPGAAPHNPQQPVALVVGDRSKLYPPGHIVSLLDRDRLKGNQTIKLLFHRTSGRCRQRHQQAAQPTILLNHLAPT
jgi:hypothetical protein